MVYLIKIMQELAKKVIDRGACIMSKIVLFYSYTYFEYPQRILKWQRQVCQDLGLTGRIIIAHEGINGTVAGSDKAIELYKTILKKHPQLATMDIKESEGNQKPFPRMRIVVKDEIVNLGLKDAARIEHTGVHLSPEQTHALLSNRPKDLVILDTRNTFESAIGVFKDAIKAEIDHFRDLPKYIDQNIDLFKDKEVLMYCTGGVRCERATAYLKELGVSKEVYQIEGGIHRYVEQYPDGHFRGKNYVFDGRVAVRVNNDVLGNCYTCQAPCDDYTNCLNARCNLHFIACATCIEQYQNCCSTHCKTLVQTEQVQRRIHPQAVNADCQHAPAQ
jgi:predicted sulfurtransferase